jgi:hypothetical protein
VRALRTLATPDLFRPRVLKRLRFSRTEALLSILDALRPTARQRLRLFEWAFRRDIDGKLIQELAKRMGIDLKKSG